MPTVTLEEIGELLGKIGGPCNFSAKRIRRSAPLSLEVEGIGRLRLPVPRRQAKRLCEIGRPARYGRGEETLLDRNVRDTWEIPKSRLKIDHESWDPVLSSVLEALRDDLGISAASRLEAEFHSMLVYAPGQFFLPHQDSEKNDAMIGTLVVTLPSTFEGGALIVEHQGKKSTYRGSQKALSFVAFYADCRHEVQPVEKGYRICLTYNLALEGSTAEAVQLGSGLAAGTEPEAVEGLADLLQSHFEDPLPPRWEWQKDEPWREPPNRLVYLLDHEYTQRGLRWDRLKGSDARRAAVLRAAAERYDCELVLALAEVHESWTCGEEWDPWTSRRRSWTRGEDDDWLEDPPPRRGPDAYQLFDLIESDVELTHWVDAAGKKSEPVVRGVQDEEVCSTTPSSQLAPHTSEYEGYMGNYGNTMDRWYRRAAVVLWPRQRTFVVRGEAAPDWAVRALEQKLRDGEIERAREMAASLQPFWRYAAPGETRRGFFTRTLRVAESLEAPGLATALLEPFHVDALTPGQAPILVALMKRYGEDWMRALLLELGNDRFNRFEKRSHRMSSLARFCGALRSVDESLGEPCARLLWETWWRLTKAEIEGALETRSPSSRAERIEAFPKPVFALLESADLLALEPLREELLGFLCADESDSLLPCLVQALRIGARQETKSLSAASFDTLRQHCLRRLRARLAVPARRLDDWSIDFPGNCACELCVTLREFLADSELEQLEWPIAKPKRKHVHIQIDAHELPVSHSTRRSGRPFTLVLRKRKALFERAAEERRRWQKDLDWLESLDRE